jgi:hypothetical protein
MSLTLQANLASHEPEEMLFNNKKIIIQSKFEKLAPVPYLGLYLSIFIKILEIHLVSGDTVPLMFTFPQQRAEHEGVPVFYLRP